jgi:hypothetical protein
MEKLSAGDGEAREREMTLRNSIGMAVVDVCIADLGLWWWREMREKKFREKCEIVL